MRGGWRFLAKRSIAAGGFAAIAPVVFPVRIFGLSQKLGEEPQEDDADCRHADTYDANVDFDCRPEAHLELVPGWVGGFCEINE